MRKITALFSVLALAVSATAVSAATFTLTPTVVASFEPGTFASIPIDTATKNGVMRLFQVDFVVSASNLQAGERGFGNVGFNIGLGGTLTEGGAGGWASNTATTDSNGAAPGGIVPLFSTNADAGPSPSDLQGIFATIAGGISAPNATDQRVKVGQAGGPNVLGSVTVKWNALADETLSVLNSQWSVYSTAGVFGTGQGTGGNVLFGGIPEPATLAMAGMGLVGIVAAARRRKS